MTKQEAYDLKPGEKAYKFTDEEIKTICNALYSMSASMNKMVLDLRPTLPAKVIEGININVMEITELQFSIEQQEHNF